MPERMKYSKPPLTFEDQAALLLKRGMTGDKAKMARRLSVVNYYRLSAYWHHRKCKDDSFIPGTEFDAAWDRYIFDRRLRLLMLDAIERIEVTIRTQLSHHHSHVHGAFGYAIDPAALPNAKYPDDRSNLIDRIQTEIDRSQV